MKKTTQEPRPRQEQLIRERLFPNVETFRIEGGGFVPLPIVLRRAQFKFNPREWQIYTYVLMRSGPDRVAWFTLQELGWDLDFASIAKLKPYVDSLVAAGWLRRENSQGKDYYLAPDPTSVFKGFRESSNGIPQDRADAMDELVEVLKKRARLRSQGSTQAENDSEASLATDDGDDF